MRAMAAAIATPLRAPQHKLPKRWRSDMQPLATAQKQPCQFRLPAPVRQLIEIAGSEFWSPGDLDRLAEKTEILQAGIEAARAALEPATLKAIIDCVQILAALPSQAMSDSDARMALQLYVVGLNDVPVDLLDLAVEKASKDCFWRPPPAKLRELVQKEMTARQRALARLQAAARLVPPERRVAAVYAAFDTAAILDEHWPDRERHRLNGARGPSP